MSKRYKIAIDVMGGDFYPEVPVQGSLMALKKLPDSFVVQLIGDEALINKELSKATVTLRYSYDQERLVVVPASQVIKMNDKLTGVARDKVDSSIHVGLRLQKDGQSDAFVSAGNTGAIIGISQIVLGRIRAVRRSALAGIFPTANGPCVNLDLGANSENIAGHLAQFGVMGSIYSRRVIGVEDPKVALMNVGKESEKGNDRIQQAQKLLKELSRRKILQFIGSLEGGDAFKGTADVIVFDGFTGNVVLKAAESFLPTLKEALQKKFHDSSIFRRFFALLSSFLLGPTIGSIKRDFDYQQYGGAPLLGVNGVVIKAHGRSTPLAMMYAIDVARKSIECGMAAEIQKELSKMPWIEMTRFLSKNA